MIAIDLEMSGLDEQKCGIIEIGALDMKNPSNIFCENARLGEDEFMLNFPGASSTVTEVTGLTEEDMRDSSKQSQEQLLRNFLKWLEGQEERIPMCVNYKDISFLQTKCIKYGLEFPYFKFMDLHSAAQVIYYQQNGKFFLEEGYTKMGLKYAMLFSGLKDVVVPHNALDDAKIAAECFSRLVFESPLLEEFSKLPMPKND